DDIVHRSVAARVVSSQTSMLVLESDADYVRYGINRSALVDILAVGPAGVELTHRAPLQIAAPQTAQVRPVDKRGYKDGPAKKAKLAVEEKEVNPGLLRDLADESGGSESNAPADGAAPRILQAQIGAGSSADGRFAADDAPAARPVRRPPQPTRIVA